MARLISDDTLGEVTTYQEAASEPLEGKVAVAEVILRRAAERFMSDGTIAGTVLAPFQFSGWNSTLKGRAIAKLRIRSVQIDDSDPAVQECRRAWAIAKGGSNYSNGALYYLNPGGVSEMPDWVAECDLVASIGNHQFYAPKEVLL